MNQFNIVSENAESTVVAEFIPSPSKRPTAYQTEAELEQDFIKQLQLQKYEFISIHTEEELIANLRKQLEKLNNYQFTDTEWKH